MLYPVRKYSAEPKEATSASFKAVTQPDYSEIVKQLHWYYWYVDTNEHSHKIFLTINYGEENFVIINVQPLPLNLLNKYK
jgi:hypothetical protein